MSGDKCITFPILRFNTQSSALLIPSNHLTKFDNSPDFSWDVGGTGEIQLLLACSIPDNSSSAVFIEVGS